MCSTDRPARGSGSNGASASGTAEDASRGSSSEAGRIRRLTPVESRHCATRAVSIAGGPALEAARRIAGALVGSFTPPALGECRHCRLARLRIAVRGACDFSWISRLAKDQQPPPQALANADHDKPVYATLLPKPDLPKPVSHKASAVANRLLSRERRCGRRQLCCGLTVRNSVVLPRTARPSNPLGYNAGAASEPCH